MGACGAGRTGYPPGTNGTHPAQRRHDEPTQGGHRTASARRPRGGARRTGGEQAAVDAHRGVDLPPPRELAYLGGIAALTAVELIEWPVGLALAAGHLVVTRARGQRPDGHEHEKEQAQHKRE
jgi:hypothetical protein